MKYKHIPIVFSFGVLFAEKVNMDVPASVSAPLLDTSFALKICY